MSVFRAIAIPAALYALALGALLVQIGERPAFPYNWESYTAWNYWSVWARPASSAAEIFAVTDGLMTESGHGPLLGLPIWLGFRLDGVGLTAMRWPVALLAALAVPLTWELGRRLTARPVAFLAAALLAVSPVFLLYGRTATLVGITLAPALLTMLALARLLELPAARRPVVWLVGLQATLILGAYAYAPVRLLWPLAAAALLAGAIGWRERRRFLVVAGLVTVVTIPVFLVAAEWLTRGSWSPAATIVGYFQVRGEHIFELGADPERYLPYIREAPAETANPFGLAWALVSQNLLDAARLVSDWQTEPVLTHYWNAHGQLWPWLLVPFFWLGFAGTVYRAISGRSWRTLLLLCLLVSLAGPLLFTTRIHVGRLAPVLPLLLLTVAGGLSLAADGLSRVAGQRLPTPAATVRLAALSALGLIVVFGAAALTLAGYQHLPAESAESRITSRLAIFVEAASEHGGAALVAPAAYGLEVEGVLPRLLAGELPDACENLYLVIAEAEPEFRQAASSAAVQVQCPAGLPFKLLPG